MFAIQCRPVHPRSLGRRTRVGIVLLTAAAAAGCGGAPAPAIASAPDDVAGDAILVVSNRHPHDVEIVARNEHRSETKLATLRVHWDRELRLPRTMNGTQVQLLVRCLRTGEIYETREIVWAPRERLDFSVEELLATSRLVQR